MLGYPIGRPLGILERMAGRLTEDRVRSDLDVLSRAGLGLDDFLREAMTALIRAVPAEGACVATHDPATVIMTSGRKYGALQASGDEDAKFVQLEYAEADQTSFRELAAAGRVAVGMGLLLQGGIPRSQRMEQLIGPTFGFAEESRTLFRDEVGVWGAVALFRGADDAIFDEDEVAYLASLSSSFARGLRSGMLATLATSVVDSTDQGPGVVIVNTNNQVVQASVGAQERLADLRPDGNGTDPMSLIHGLVGAARVVAQTPGARLPRARVRTASGKWLALHASPMASVSGDAVDVVVTIEEARPPEIVELVVAGFGLTPRERDVTRLVLQGVETKEIATTLHLSAYTVQDHLKSVFDKASVRSRRELISRVFLDHYLPRQGVAMGPTGWFAP